MSEAEDVTHEVIEITIGSTIKDIDAAISDAKDLAWEHAVELAKSTKTPLGSEEFEETFRELSMRYEHQVDHLKFFLMTAMITLRELLERDVIALPYEGEKITEAEILEGVSRAAHSLVGTFVWLAAGYEFTWPTNDELPEDIQIPFYFNLDEILEEDN
jgi:hypothetical protein